MPVRDQDAPVSTRALRASISSRTRGAWQPSKTGHDIVDYDSSTNKLLRTTSTRSPSVDTTKRLQRTNSSRGPSMDTDRPKLVRSSSSRTTGVYKSSQPQIPKQADPPSPSSDTNFLMQPPTRTPPPKVPKLNLGNCTLGQPNTTNAALNSATTSAHSKPPSPAVSSKYGQSKTLARCSSMPSQNAAQQQSQLVAVVDKDMDPSPQELEAAHAEIQELRRECARLMMDKSAAQQHTQAVISNRDSLQTELAALKKDHSNALREHLAVAEELEQCQQQLSEMAASSKVASTTSEIYTRALSQTVALRMSHANEMEELQLVMEEKDEAVRMMRGLVMKLQEELQAAHGGDEQVMRVQKLLEGTTAERDSLVEEMKVIRKELATALQESRALQTTLKKKAHEAGVAAAEKVKLTARLMDMESKLKQRAAQQEAALPPRSPDSQSPQDLPSALSLLEHSSSQNEALRGQKRHIEGELERALVELQVLKDQVQVLVQGSTTTHDKQAVGGGKRVLRFALRSVRRMVVYSTVAAIAVASTNGGKEHPAADEEDQQQQQQPQPQQQNKGLPFFGDGESPLSWFGKR